VCFDFSNDTRSGRSEETVIHAILAHKQEMDPHTTARKLALSFDVSPSTGMNHLNHDLEMKCYCLWRAGLTIPEDHGVSEKASESRLSEFVHPPYSPDRALSGFFLFCHLGEHSTRSESSTPNELEDIMIRTMKIFPRVILIDFFASWEEGGKHGSKGKMNLWVKAFSICRKIGALVKTTRSVQVCYGQTMACSKTIYPNSDAVTPRE
jgi:hypothetical protein